jgi:carbon-monoxide dehydrogenase medium subunit
LKFGSVQVSVFSIQARSLRQRTLERKIMGPFEYLEPLTIEEAVALLSKYGNKAKVLAGGTDLVPLMKERRLRPECVISIWRIADLDYIRVDGDNGLSIGALTTIRSIEQSPQLQPRYGLICQAAGQMASTSVRNVATIGGNICNAVPSADMLPGLIALSGATKLVSHVGQRTVSLEDFFTGPGETVLRTDELLAEIQIPRPPAHTAGVYIKYSTRGGEDLALVGVAASLTLDPGNETCTEAKVVLGAVAPTPIRARRAEEMLIGEKINKGLAEKAARTASDESSPIDDIRGSAEYRREMIKIVARDAIRRAAELAKSAI